MIWNNTPITYRDVLQWKDDFQNAKAVIDHMLEKTDGDKAYIKQRMNDALFLVAFVESLLSIEVDDIVYNRARELQRAEESED